jgi:hypothetical protein
MAEHQVMSCGTGITAINATSCRTVGYCWWNSRFHCLLIKDRKQTHKRLSRRTALAHRKDTFILLRAGYSTHKRFVLGGEECAPPFPCRSVVAH